MPRLNYLAPGVYVEEVPSARQPIAGVGTNTVAFIGLVPDVVYIPRANDNYNPVKAREEADKAAQAKAAAGPAKRSAESRPDPALVEDEKAKQRALDDATRKLQAAAAGSDTAALKKAVDDAKDAHAKAAEALAKARTAAAATGGGQGDAEDLTYEWSKPANDTYIVKDEEQRKKYPEERPYYFEEFTVKAPEFATKLCTNFSEYAAQFGDFSGFAISDDAAAPGQFKPLSPGHHMLTHAVAGFFRNGGTRCFVARIKSEAGLKTALERLESIDEVAILAAPGLPKKKDNWKAVTDYCEHPDHMNVFGILDLPGVVGQGRSFQAVDLKPGAEGMPAESKYAAAYFPYIEVSDPAKRLQDEDPARGIPPKYRGLTYVPPSGHMAGLYARTDEERGVHKAPANAVLRGALEVKYYVSKAHQEILNPVGVNCLRIMGGAVVPWGARTIGGDRNGEWKYVNVRRFAGFLMESIDEGTQWIVFEPNDPALWSKIRLNVTAFLTNVWRNGALFGLTPEEAFYVKCDEELNPPEVRDLGQVITEIGVAIVRPAEFVIFRISQASGPQKG